MYNKIILVGNLTRDPELRYTPQGTSICTFRIAVNTPYKQQNGESKDETLFIDVVTFARQAEVCGQYLSKGRTVLVEGRLRENRWESEDGQKRSKYEVLAQSVKFVSKKSEDTNMRRDEYIPPETTIEDPF
ncbi:MAG: single-stranded DNA-binding protein [Nitrospirae bacterium]|nr:MAG: single-stranded DNA-binding protein [Nitrospirota bacterium]